jgi:hypothetical protein
MNNKKNYPNKMLIYSFEKIINKMVDRKFKKTKNDLSSLIINMSKNAHKKNLGEFNGISNMNDFGSSLGQTIDSLASSIQKSFFRNL